MASKKKKSIHSGISEEFWRKNEKYLETVLRLRLIDDNFMTKVFEDIECTQLLLNIILDRNDLTVCEVQPQYGVKSLQGRSVRLDILARDKDGIMYNVEVQRGNEGADFKRARYNSSMLDANLTNAGEKYAALGETYVIFITEHDVIEAGLPIYHIDRIIRETGKVFNDGAHIIYVNAQHISDTPLGKLMHDFFCTNADDMYYATLATRVRHFKETEKGAANMCYEIEKLVNEGIAEGEAKGETTGKAKMILSIMNANKVDFAAAVKMAGCSDEDAAALKPIVDAMLETENAGE